MQLLQLAGALGIATLLAILGWYHLRMAYLRAQDESAPPVVAPESWRWAQAPPPQPQPQPPAPHEPAPGDDFDMELRALIAMGPEEVARLADPRPEVPRRFSRELLNNLSLRVAPDAPNRLWLDHDVQTLWRVWAAGQRLNCEACGRVLADNPLCPWCSRIQGWAEDILLNSDFIDEERPDDE